MKKITKHISVFDRAEESPGFLLWQVTLLWRRGIEDILRPYGLTHVQFVLLAGIWYLTQHDTLITQNQLAEFTRCDVGMVSQVLRFLQRKGLIQRVQQQDERSKHPILTRSGFELLQKTIKQIEKFDTHFFSVLHNIDDLKKMLITLASG